MTARRNRRSAGIGYNCFWLHRCQIAVNLWLINASYARRRGTACIAIRRRRLLKNSRRQQTISCHLSYENSRPGRGRAVSFTGGPRPRPSHVTARYIMFFSLRGKPRTRQTPPPDRGRIQLMTDLFRRLMSAGAYGGVSLKDNATRGTRRRVKTLADSGEGSGPSCHQLVDPGQPLSTV